jgi:DNA-binding GntR family transcriptional regulator
MPPRVNGKPSNLSPLARVNLHPQDAGRIGPLIAQEKFASGSLLPTESPLGTKFGVSRTRLRDPSKVLAAKRLAEVRRKTAMVRANSRWNLLHPGMLSRPFLGTDMPAALTVLLGVSKITKPAGARMASRKCVAYKRTVRLHRTVLGAIKSRNGPKAVLMVLAQTSRDITAELKKQRRRFRRPSKGELCANKKRTHERP